MRTRRCVRRAAREACAGLSTRQHLVYAEVTLGSPLSSVQVNNHKLPFIFHHNAQVIAFHTMLTCCSLCGLTLAANSALVFTVFTFSNTLSCLGTNYTQKGYQDSLCYPEGTSSFSWRLVSASVVARRYEP